MQLLNPASAADLHFCLFFPSLSSSHQPRSLNVKTPQSNKLGKMNLTSGEWSLPGIHLHDVQGGRQAEFKSSKLVDDKLIHLSKSLPRGDQNKQHGGSWRSLVKEERLRDVTGRGGGRITSEGIN